MSDCAKILIVEDVPEIRESLKDVLEVSGYKVSTAANGQEAIDMLKNDQNMCLILLDLMMPVMNGWEFLKERKESSSLSMIPVVVTTAAADTALRGVEAEAIMKKPIAFPDLLSWVERYCGTSSC